jgi:hypothetical protein
MRAAPRFPCRSDGDTAGAPHDAATVSPDVKKYGRRKGAHRAHKSSEILKDCGKDGLFRTRLNYRAWNIHGRRQEATLAIGIRAENFG